MNWLAHLRLARQTPLDRLGQLSGDFVRGPLGDDLHPTIRRGVREHRALDVWVDAHEASEEVRCAMPQEFRRFAGIVFDLMSDHVLARDWERLGPAVGLPAFSARIRSDVENHLDLCPPRLAEIGRRKDIGDLLLSYADLGGLELAVERIGRRFRRPIDLTPTVTWFRRNEAFVTDAAATLFEEAAGFLAEHRRHEEDGGFGAP